LEAENQKVEWINYNLEPLLPKFKKILGLEGFEVKARSYCKGSYPSTLH
jgi:hypothetical protein